MCREIEGSTVVKRFDTWQRHRAPHVMVETRFDRGAIEYATAATPLLRVLVVDDDRDTANSMSVW